MRKLIFILSVCIPALMFSQSAGKGFDAIDAKDYGEAKAVFDKILASDPGDVSALLGLSRACNFKGWDGFSPNQAMEYLEKAEAKISSFGEKDWKQLEKYKLDKASVTTLRTGIERAILNQINENPDEDAYFAFMQRFPKSVVFAYAKKDASKAGAAKAKSINTIEACTAFLNKYPEADEYPEIERKRDQLALAEAIHSQTADAFRLFLRTYPNSPVKAEAEQQLHSRAFEEAKTANTSDAMVEYISEFPNSVFLNMAKDAAKELREMGK